MLNVNYIAKILFAFTLLILIFSFMGSIYMNNRLLLMPVSRTDTSYTYEGLYSNVKGRYVSPYHRYYPVNCSAIFAGDNQTISSAQALLDTMRNSEGKLPVPSDSEVADWFSNCSNFKSTRRYPETPMSKEEEDFPIAYVIVTHNEVAQVERLLRVIYQPQNVYCIHPDLHSPKTFQRSISKLASCFPNVFIASEQVRVLRGNITLVLANHICMKDLLRQEIQWKYLINLCAKDFPLKTNFEIVQQLKAYNGHNAVKGHLILRKDAQLDKVVDRWTFHHYFVSYNKYPENSWKLKNPPPHNIIVYKGNTYIAATRKFVDFIVNDPEANDFLTWLYDTKTPDETFTPTLQRHLRAPGGCPYPTMYTNLRFITWTPPGKEHLCPGKRVHAVCVFDISFLKALKKITQLFVNKLHYDFDPITMQCMEELLEYRARNEDLFQKEIPRFPISFNWSRHTSPMYIPGL